VETPRRSPDTPKPSAATTSTTAECRAWTSSGTGRRVVLSSVRKAEGSCSGPELASAGRSETQEVAPVEGHSLAGDRRNHLRRVPGPKLVVRVSLRGSLSVIDASDLSTWTDGVGLLNDIEPYVKSIGAEVFETDTRRRLGGTSTHAQATR
jgi:hypothetical protein